MLPVPCPRPLALICILDRLPLPAPRMHCLLALSGHQSLLRWPYQPAVPGSEPTLIPASLTLRQDPQILRHMLYTGLRGLSGTGPRCYSCPLCIRSLLLILFPPHLTSHWCLLGSPVKESYFSTHNASDTKCVGDISPHTNQFPTVWVSAGCPIT